MNTPKLTIRCAGNAGLIYTLLKEYGMEAEVEQDTQVLTATGYGLDAHSLSFRLFAMLAILTVDNSIESFTFTRG